MKYIYLLSIFFIFNLYGLNLDIQSRLIPKIVFYDKNYSNNLIDNRLVISIFYDDLNIKQAFLLKKKIENSKSNKEYLINIDLYSYSNIDDFKKSSAIFLFRTENKKAINNILKISKQNSIPVFVSSKKMLRIGGHIYMDLLKEIKIYYNKDSVNRANIEFRLSFLKAVELFNE